MVTDASGNPLAGICVDAMSGNSGSGGPPSNGDGAFTIAGLSPGDYTLQYFDCGNGLYTTAYFSYGSSTHTSDRNSADSITVNAGQVSSIPVAMLSVGGTISGLVKNASGHPLAGICVNAFGNNNGFGGPPSDANGAFSITGVPTGSFRVQFNDCNGGVYSTVYYTNTLVGSGSAAYSVGTSSYSSAALVSVSAGATTSISPVWLSVGGSISGVVKDASGNSLAGICVNAQSNNSGVGAQPTGSDGAFTISGLSAGNYRVQFNDCSRGTFTTTYYTDTLIGSSSTTHTIGTASYTSATQVSVSAGATTSISPVWLSVGGSISGVVKNSNGQPLAGICVSAQGNNSGFGGPPSNSNGSYTLGGLPAGTYRVQFNDCSGGNYATKYYDGTDNGTSSYSAAQMVTVVAATNTGQINVAMSQGGSISGMVTDSTGAPIAGECVSAQANGYGSGAQTGADGSYVVTGLVPGTYKVYFSACSGGSYTSAYYDGSLNGTLNNSSAALVLVTSGATTSRINISLQQGGSIWGRVTNGSTGIAGVCVSAVDSSNNFLNAVQSGSDGTFTISGLAAGNYRINFTGCGNSNYISGWYSGTTTESSSMPGAGSAGSINVTVGSTSNLPDPSTVILIGGTISGHVTDDQGQPLSGICPMAQSGSSGFGGPPSDANGAFSIMGLAPGTYEVLFSSCGSGSYIGVWYSGTSTTGSATMPGSSSPGAIVVSSNTTTTLTYATQMVVGGSISGRLTNAQGLPVSGICPSARSGNSGIGGQQTDSNGNFSINGLAAGTYTVQFYNCSGGSYTSGWYSGVSTPVSSQSSGAAVTVAAGATTTLVTTVLSQGGSISMLAQDSSGNPVAGVCLTAWFSVGNNNYQSLTSLASSSDGMVTLAGLSPNTYGLKLNGCGVRNYIASWYDGTTSGIVNPSMGQAPPGATTVSLQAGDSINLTSTPMKLAMGTSISGSVTNPSSSGLANICVNAQSGQLSYFAATDQSGHYTIVGLPAGSYNVQFIDCSGNNYQTSWYSSSSATGTSSNLATSVSVDLNTPGIGINIQLSNGVQPHLFSAGGVASSSPNIVGRVADLNQVILFPPPTGSVQVGTTYTPLATATSRLAVAYSIDSTTATGVCTYSGGTVTFTGVGTCLVDANQAGDTNWVAAAQVQISITVTQGNQTISFQSSKPTNAMVGGPSYTPIATATSTLAVIFGLDASSTAGACVLNSGTVSFTGVGTCVIDASQSGNSNYLAAVQLQQSFNVALGSQTITFTSSPPLSITNNTTTYFPTALSTSKLPVEVTIDASSSVGACSIHSGTVTFTGYGNCVIDANQYGGSGYGPAQQAQQNIDNPAPTSGGSGGGGSGGTINVNVGATDVISSILASAILTGSLSTTSAALAWATPNVAGATVTGFVLQISSDAGASWTTISSSTASVLQSYVATGLTSGSSYSFRIAFYYNTGANQGPQLSSFSAPVAFKTLSPPSPPSNPSVSESGTTVTISWTASSSPGVTGYSVTSSPSGYSCSSTSATCSISGLAVGSYTFSIYAIAAQGNSVSVSTALVAVSNPIPPNAPAKSPSAPKIRVTSPLVGRAVISLQGAVISKFAPVTSYQYSLNGGTWHSISRQKNGTFVISKLAVLKVYAVRLRAVNTYGAGNASAQVSVKIK